MGDHLSPRRVLAPRLGPLAAAAGLLALAPAAWSSAPSPSAAAAAPRQRACPTFRVARPDRAAGYRAGVYDLSVSGPISCRGALRLFRRYLRHPDSPLPRGWRHRRHYAGFANRRAAFNVYQPFRRTTHHRFGAVRLCQPAASVFPRERVGFRPGHHALLAWGRTPCDRARAAFRSYARRGAVPAPYRLDRQRTAFSAGRSGFEVAYRDYALRGPHRGSPDPNDACAKGEFDFYVCVELTNGGEITLTNVSESHSCGLTDPGPPESIAPGGSLSYRVHCAVGFWGSIHYDVSVSSGTQSATGGIDITYTTFGGTFACQVTGDATRLIGGCNDAGGDMLPENQNATFENWHYSIEDSD
ncbi:MAG TPA: hypothetical protein VE780_01850 [Thermoleophilaceae bacterium]|nr:hypothetical protein [Thermoleophilaceae bacterium]